MKTNTMKMMWRTLFPLAVAFATVAMPLSAEAAAKRKSPAKVLSGTVNLNTATAAQLDQLPGVGQKAAERILAHRSKTPFARTEELVKVKGFGKKKFDKLKAHLAVSGPTTLKVVAGTATPEPAAQGRAAPTSR